MISRELLRHRLWSISIGYQPHHTVVRTIVESHLEALDEIDRLISELRTAREAR